MEDSQFSDEKKSFCGQCVNQLKSSVATFLVLGFTLHAAPAFASLLNDSLQTEAQYLQALTKADEAEFRKNFETYFLLILSKKQKKAYASYSSLEDRKVYIEAYWNAANPNPLFPENDWILEFNRRVEHAKTNFPAPRSPFVDARGRYYIKYGKPRRRFEDPGGHVSANFFNKPNIQKWFQTQNVTYSLAPNETWSYENVADNLIVHFVREGNVFREVSGLVDMIESGFRNNQAVVQGMRREPNWQYWLWADMIKRRTGISPIINFYRGKIDLLETTLIQAAGSSNPQMYLLTNAEEVAVPQSVLHRRAMELDMTVDMIKKRAPSAAHDPVQGESKIEFDHRVSQFRGPNGKTRIDITLLSKLKKNLLKKGKNKVGDALDLKFSGMLRDANFQSIIKNETAFLLERQQAKRANLESAAGSLALLAAPQTVEMTLQVEEVVSQKLGFSRHMVDIRDFSGEGLQISDVSFLLEAKNERLRQALPVTQFEGLTTSPYPWVKIKKSRPPLFYFEIYNLKDAGMAEDVEISYRISSFSGSVPAEGSGKRKSSVSSTYTRTVGGNVMQELIEINLANVSKGRRLLEITVSHPGDRSISATVNRLIEID